MNTIELQFRSKDEVGRRLSNLYARPFEFAGRRYGSFEGFLQALKHEDVEAQELLAPLSGYEAFKVGQLGNGWQETQTLWLSDVPFARTSDEYQGLLVTAYDAQLEQNLDMVEALLATGNAILTHSIGKHDATKTTLTPSEYVSQMYRLRSLVHQMG